LLLIGFALNWASAFTHYFSKSLGAARRQVDEFIAAIQTFGDRINAQPHLHFLVTEGGVGKAGPFHKISRIDDSRLAEIYAREVGYRYGKDRGEV
jgi:hypothetical protein